MAGQVGASPAPPGRSRLGTGVTEGPVTRMIVASGGKRASLASGRMARQGLVGRVAQRQHPSPPASAHHDAQPECPLRLGLGVKPELQVARVPGPCSSSSKAALKLEGRGGRGGLTQPRDFKLKGHLQVACWRSRRLGPGLLPFPGGPSPGARDEAPPPPALGPV
jgi:hypothetical protein